jgi:hypothetical protein
MAESECLLTIIQRLQAKTTAIQEKMVANRKMAKVTMDTAMSYGRDAMDKRPFRK